MGWLGSAELGAEIAAAIIVVLVLAVLIGLFSRRRWLSRGGGMFDCAGRLHPMQSGSRPLGGWSAGMARYHQETFQWFRIFSVSLGPKLVLTRRGARIIERREANEGERAELLGLTSVLRLELPARTGGTRTVELAMTPASATGLMSWLEAAPPGTGQGGQRG